MSKEAACAGHVPDGLTKLSLLLTNVHALMCSVRQDDWALELDSSTPAKFSRHLIVRCVCVCTHKCAGVAVRPPFLGDSLSAGCGGQSSAPPAIVSRASMPVDQAHSLSPKQASKLQLVRLAAALSSTAIPCLALSPAGPSPCTS